jgi:hypothetical protein
VADNDLDPAGKRRFAQAFTTTMRTGGAGRKRGYVIGVAAAVVISGGAAVAVGAIDHSKPAGKPHLLSLGTPSRTSSTSPSRSASGDPLPRPGTSQPSVVYVGGGGSFPGNTPPEDDVSGGGASSGEPSGGGSSGGEPSGGGSSGGGSSDPSSSTGGSTTVGTPPKSSPPATVVPVKASNSNSGSLFITGQLDCQSGAQVEGMWVQAADASGSGWASWKKLDSGSVADWWYTLPTNEAYHLNVGCGGSTENWAVTVKSWEVTGWHNSFNCYDAPGKDQGQCIPR